MQITTLALKFQKAPSFGGGWGMLYAFNNPVFWIDPNGKLQEGTQTSYGTDLSSAAGLFNHFERLSIC